MNKYYTGIGSRDTPQDVYPFNIVDGELEVQHKQNDSLTFDVPEDTPKELVQDWYKRELSRGNI